MKSHTLTFALSLFFLCLSPLATADEVVHVLQKGETLYSISRKYNVPADAIMTWNKLSDPGKLRAGEKLRIPDMYSVQKGDTLYGIARKLSLPVETLLSANNLDMKSKLKAGQTLYIPLSDAGSVRAPIPTPDSEQNPPAAPAKNDTTKQGANGSVVASSASAAPVAKPVAENSTSKSLDDPRSFEKRKVDSSLIWPVTAKEIAYLSGKVYGVSITSDVGSKVKVISSGTVISTGPYRGYGQVVFLQSKSGFIYVYGGLQEISSRVGDTLAFGDEIGNLGADSLSGKPQLYFMVYNKDVPVDPAKAPRGY
jgi:murein DD-endopeptidase MepM/ murein hydrolase activator NlpD